MDMDIIIIGISSGVALILGIANWSRNGKNTKQGNLLNNEIHTLKEDVKKLKTFKEQEKTNDINGEISRENDNNEISHSLNYFKIAENWHGQGRIININFTKGNYQDVTYVYDHDYVYNKVIAIYQKLPAWQNHGCFSNSTNIPNNIIQLFTNQNNIPRNTLHFVAFPINN